MASLSLTWKDSLPSWVGTFGFVGSWSPLRTQRSGLRDLWFHFQIAACLVGGSRARTTIVDLVSKHAVPFVKPNSAYLALRYPWCLALLLWLEQRCWALQFALPSFLTGFEVSPIELGSRLFLSSLFRNRKSLYLLWLSVFQPQKLLLNIWPPIPDSLPSRLGGPSKFRLSKVVSDSSGSGVNRQFQWGCLTFASGPRAHCRLNDCSTHDLARFDRVFVSQMAYPFLGRFVCELVPSKAHLKDQTTSGIPYAHQLLLCVAQFLDCLLASEMLVTPWNLNWSICSKNLLIWLLTATLPLQPITQLPLPPLGYCGLGLRRPSFVLRR